MRVLSLLLAITLLLISTPLRTTAQAPCAPTAPDLEGPFYKPGAPIRESTGRGLVVRGTVKSAGACTPIPGARVEWWQANPSHIHFKVSAPGHRALTTQLYPKAGQSPIAFDLVLVPE
ncbi:MAG: hypothetical protein HY725_20880 [Candidatus Rokubacteria bacterium]|nr:hypothetical protein [Candidatus Rokubacteria bacterium]